MGQWQSGRRDSRAAKFAGIVALGLACFGLSLSAADAPTVTSPCSKPLPPELFNRWPTDKKPEVAIVLSGEQHSYLKFCGCSPIQYGGYERRYNFIAKLKEKGWPVVALDLGDLIQEKAGTHHEQTMLKYTTAMNSLSALGYVAVGVGPNDLNLPLHEGLFAFSQIQPNPSQRILAANIVDREQRFPDPNNPDKSILADLITVPGQNGTPSVGAIALLGPTAQKSVEDKSIKFAEDNQKLIPALLKKLDDQKADLRVLLYQGTGAQAAAAAQKFPQFQLILARSLAEEPATVPTMVGDTMIVEVGWRGRYVGVVGAFRDANGTFDLHFQPVRLGPELETDADKETGHPVLDILQTYAQKVKDADLMHKVTKIPHPTQVKFPAATFIGSDKCQMCHQAEFTKWKASGHSHAWECLTKKAVKPTLRQFDPECIGCHVVGFANNTGFVDDTKTPHLLHVGCENCHGPGSLHASNQNNPAFKEAMMPWRAPNSKDRVVGANGKYDQALLMKIDGMCQKCHDQDNDPIFRFEDYWPSINHSRGQKPPPAKNPPKPKK